MEYRRAILDDLDELVELRMAMRAEREEGECAIELEDFRARTREYFLERLRDEGIIIWVAVDIGAIVAMSGLCIHNVPPTYGNPSGKVGYIANMYTVPKHRGKGVARELLERLMVEARNRGCGRATLNTSRAGRGIYERYGFRDVSGEMEYYLNP